MRGLEGIGLEDAMDERGAISSATLGDFHSRAIAEQGNVSDNSQGNLFDIISDNNLLPTSSNGCDQFYDHAKLTHLCSKAARFLFALHLASQRRASHLPSLNSP